MFYNIKYIHSVYEFMFDKTSFESHVNYNIKYVVIARYYVDMMNTSIGLSLCYDISPCRFFFFFKSISFKETIK